MASVMATEAKVFTDEIEEIKVESSKSVELKNAEDYFGLPGNCRWMNRWLAKASTEVETVVPGIESGSADQIALI